MTNHPHRSKRDHILKICRRGFQNETTYVSVSAADYAEADAYLNTLVDDVDDVSKWLDPGTKLVNGARVEYRWPRYKAEWIDPYA